MHLLKTLDLGALRAQLAAIEEHGKAAAALADMPLLDPASANAIRGTLRLYRKAWKQTHARLREAEFAYAHPDDLDAIEIQGKAAAAELAAIKAERPYSDEACAVHKVRLREAQSVYDQLQTKYRAVRDNLAD